MNSTITGQCSQGTPLHRSHLINDPQMSRLRRLKRSHHHPFLVIGKQSEYHLYLSFVRSNIRNSSTFDPYVLQIRYPRSLEDD